MADKLLGYWKKAEKFPGGRFFFNRMLRFAVPYTGTIKPNVLELEPGHAKVRMRDRRIVRNHLNSIHAIALLNLGELVTGLAMSSQLTSQSRAIITGLSMEYKKKARGLLEAECHFKLEDPTKKAEYQIEGIIRDTSGDIVAIGKATWLVGPR